ncbi:MAG: 1-acyl-sn-glycerol-3-phosphate acyltransferase [Synechococcaceae cyanobacterium RL_1_2]|nr:1-acyl-sn-glycerol-3-phosphate acyltransferase [Synechococcaceae cyanobacterium RL_1_2]
MQSFSPAQPPLEFIPPKFNPWVLKGAQTILPAVINLKTNINAIEGRELETLVKLWQQFQAKQIRLLIAFRHPSVADPLVMMELFRRLLPHQANQMGISLNSPIHSHFIYDRGIPLWAGKTVEWLFPRLGGTPIQRGRFDSLGLKSARRLFVDGQFPLMASPEGGTNGHNQIVSPLEPGMAQLSFWCAQDLETQGRTEQVVILPVGIQYCYDHEPWAGIDLLLSELEQELNIDIDTKVNQSRYERLYGLGKGMLMLMEKFYTQAYSHQFPPLPNPEQMNNEIFSARLQNLLDVCLQVAEDYFKVAAKGTTIDRCRRLEQIGWDRIYRQEFREVENLAPVEVSLANLVATEAQLRLCICGWWKNFVAVSGQYVKEQPSADRFADTLLIIHEGIARIKGEKSKPAPSLGKRNAMITIGQPIAASDRYPGYKQDRRCAKKAVTDLTLELQSRLESLIM